MNIAVFAAFVSVLIYVAVKDFKTMKIPQWTFLILLGIGIAQMFGTGPPETKWISALLGFLVGGIPLYILFVIPVKGMPDGAQPIRRFGAGDVKLAACAGLVLGIVGSYLAVFAAVILLLTGGLLRKVLKSGTVYGPIAFGPYYAAAATGAYLFLQILHWR